MSIRTCEHIQDDGLRCPNRAMYRRQICYQHWRILRPSAPVCDPAYVPPTFDCEASVSLMTAHILRCLLAGKIDVRRAQVAMTCVRETAKSLRLQGKVGECSEPSFTSFMADYYSTLDEIQAKSAAAYPDPQPLIYPAHFADIPEDDAIEADEIQADETPAAPQSAAEAPTLPSRTPAAALSSRTSAAALSSRAPVVRGEGSAFAPVTHAASAAAAAPEGSPWRHPWVSVTSTSPAPAGATDKKLSVTQTKLLKKILRRGPSHPQFKLAARLLDRRIATNSA